MYIPYEEIVERLARIENLLLEKNSQKAETVPPEQDRVLNIDQAAELLNTTRGQIYQLIHKKKIPYSKRGRLFFSEKELRMWIQSGRIQTIQEIQDEAKKSLYK
jgi:excisionase family DNA binding protein